MSRRLTLLGRADCHLCEDMAAELEALRGQFDFSVEVIDVDRHPELARRWGDQVPVLLHGEAEICHFFLDRRALEAWLARMQ